MKGINNSLSSRGYMINNLNKIKRNNNTLSKYTQRKEFNLSNKHNDYNTTPL